MQSWFEPAIITAGMSVIAAAFSAFAAWRAPLNAARMAEQLRKAGDEAADQRRFKLNVFATVMQERSELYSDVSVKALNSIDIAFNQSVPVREAWAELYQALNVRGLQEHVVEERLRKLLRAMAIDLGLGESLRLDDFARIYIPTALAQERSVRDHRRRREYEQLASIPTANDQALESKWPPPPQG